MERRKFLTGASSVCILAGTGLLWNSLSSCATEKIFKTTVSDKKIFVPLSLFATENLKLIRAKEYDYDIALRKMADGNFSALQMRCTHADNPLQSTGNRFICPLHGSTFNQEGAVTKGPAEFSLQHLKTEITDNNVVILIS